MNSIRDWPSLAATPRPGDYSLGSPESRAAARVQLQQAEREPKPMVRIFEEGALVTAYECEGLEEDITVQIECSGGRDGDRTEKAPEQAAAQALPEEQHQQQPAEHVSQPTPGQSTFAIMSPEKPKRKFPLTRTGAAMAFLRGGRSR